MLKLNQITPTIDELFEDFINSKRANGTKNKTLQTYSQHFHTISKDLATDMKISELSKKDLERCILALKARGISSNSVRSYTATLQSFFSWLNEEGYTNLRVKLFKGEETVKDTYTDAELSKLLIKPDTKKCSFSEYRNWVIINLLLNSGCRASTIRNILIKDVDLENSVIRYRHTKNGSSQIVPLCQEMKRILKDYMRARGGQLSDFLFPSEKDTQITENGLSEAIRKYNRARGITKTSIHLFRHSYAERYLKAGGNAFNLQKILGHSTLDMTKHYCRIYDKELVKNYDAFSPLQTLGR